MESIPVEGVNSGNLETYFDVPRKTSRCKEEMTVTRMS
jgi:hypothetical protein